MNLERVTKLREQLLNIPGKFAYEEFGKTWVDQNYFYYSEIAKANLCNTSACVAGWCVLLNPEIPETDINLVDFAATTYLELSHNESRFLFYPDNHYAIKFGFKTKDGEHAYRNYTLDDAIERLDHLINLEKAKCQPQ